MNGTLLFAFFVTATLWCAWRNEVTKRKAREAQLRNPGPKQMVFVRTADKKTVDVICCACRTCKNFFWTVHNEIEAPHFCPYCGIKFTATTQVTADEMRDIQVL